MNLKGVVVDWAEEFNGAITVCNKEGIIVYMNHYSIKQFEKYGGAELLGTNLLDCHTESSKSKLVKMLENPSENIYTILKDGVKKIIYQTPWREKGFIKGIIEISFQLVPGMPEFIRD